jgi:SAM-dependent methyltransferase
VCSSRIIEIQGRMSERAIELLALPDDEPKYILDIGCGSGLSGDVIEEHGHMWVGVDISPAMLGARVPLFSTHLGAFDGGGGGDVVPLSLSRLT